MVFHVFSHGFHVLFHVFHKFSHVFPMLLFLKSFSYVLPGVSHVFHQFPLRFATSLPGFSTFFPTFFFWPRQVRRLRLHRGGRRQRGLPPGRAAGEERRLGAAAGGGR